MKESENHRVLRYLITKGELTAVQAVYEGVSANLRSRVSELRKGGFDIADRQKSGETFKRFFIPQDRLEINRIKLLKAIYG
jgi:hypothetical protein